MKTWVLKVCPTAVSVYTAVTNHFYITAHLPTRAKYNCELGRFEITELWDAMNETTFLTVASTEKAAWNSVIYQDLIKVAWLP